MRGKVRRIGRILPEHVKRSLLHPEYSLSLCTLYLHVRLVRVTVGDSGLCCTCYVFRALINFLMCYLVRVMYSIEARSVSDCVHV